MAKRFPRTEVKEMAPYNAAYAQAMKAAAVDEDGTGDWTGAAGGTVGTCVAVAGTAGSLASPMGAAAFR